MGFRTLLKAICTSVVKWSPGTPACVFMTSAKHGVRWNES